MWLPVCLPPNPAIETMHDWTVEQMQHFLAHVAGDFCDKAKLGRYASVLARHSINGACLKSSSHSWVAECGVPTGDQVSPSLSPSRPPSRAYAYLLALAPGHAVLL